MPAFPASVQQVITLTSDIDSSPKDLVKVIDHDPVLTMKILKVANSAYFGLSRKIVSINHAVVYPDACVRVPEGAEPAVLGPDPVHDHGVDESCDEDGVDDVAKERASLRHGPGHNRRCSGGKCPLEEKVSVATPIFSTEEEI